MDLLNTVAFFDSSSEESSEECFDYDIYNDEVVANECFKLIRGIRTSVKDYIGNVVNNFTEAEFRMHFRISRNLFDSLTTKFENFDEFKNLRNDKRLSSQNHLAIFLWFAGHECCSYRDLSDRFNISISTVCHVIERVTYFISSLSPSIIKWQTEDEKRDSSNFFKNKCGFSKAIGCIDGTHIIIDPPKGFKNDYIDRKGNVSVCLQAICDQNKKFINLFVGYPGSSHDSWVFQNSPIYENLDNNCGDYYILGDSAYPCTKHVVTPYRDNGHLTSAQKQFNIKLSSGRVCIEHSFGILKQRFRQLYYCKLRGMKKLCHFVRACCVLHNIANENDLEFMIEDEFNELHTSNESFGQILRGNAIRDPICLQIQNRLFEN